MKRRNQNISPSKTSIQSIDWCTRKWLHSAQTLPNPIQFAETPSLAPYVPGSNKQQYLRGRGKQTKPFDASTQEDDEPRVVPLIAYNPLIKTSEGNFVSAQTLPNQIQFAEAQVLEPYVPGSNKQQYLRGRGKQTKPFDASAQQRKTNQTI